jgi:cold shock CspA family protein
LRTGWRLARNTIIESTFEVGRRALDDRERAMIDRVYRFCRSVGLPTTLARDSGPPRGGKDIFVHASALDRAGITGLTEGQRVAVDVIDGRKGPEAAGLRLI